MEKSLFQKTAAELGRRLLEAAVDHAAFEIPLTVCDLSHCRATCCHDGVILSDEEAAILGNEGPGIVTGSCGRPRTATVSADSDQCAADYPAHFPRTRCLFLDEQHRCQWQVRAVREGRSPWYYKPISCWMHPLVLQERGDRPVLTLLSRDRDRERFASFTPCGRRDQKGVAARLALRAELEMLGDLSGRNFYGELNAPPGLTSSANDLSSG